MAFWQKTLGISVNMFISPCGLFEFKGEIWRGYLKKKTFFFIKNLYMIFVLEW